MLAVVLTTVPPPPLPSVSPLTVRLWPARSSVAPALTATLPLPEPVGKALSTPRASVPALMVVGPV